MSLQLNDMKSKYEKLFSELNELKSRTSMIFNEDQIESVFKKVVWSETTISESLALRFKIGKLSYDYLRSKGFPIPSYRLICRRSLEETKDQFKCKICEKSFSTQKLLKSHKNSSHLNGDQNSIESDSEEDKTLEDSSVSMNQNIESREKPYFCSLSGCDERFLIINELKTHLNKVHEKEKLVESKKILKPNKTLLKCNSCQFTTHLNYKLKRHNASFHSNERPFKCPANGCQLRFKLKDHLTQHQFRVHSTERPHRCLWPECGASFKTKCLLRIHRRRHTGEKPFVCDWPECSAKFYTNCVLKAHQLNHTKPFKCQFSGCDKAFGAKREMNKHFETQHKK